MKIKKNSAYIVLISTFLMFIMLLPNDVLCSNLIYRETFDDKSVVAPPFGSMTIQRDGPAVYGTDYFWATGRGGTGYSLSGAQNKSTGIMWRIYQNWPTDEIYTSFWMRYANYTRGTNASNGTPETNENFKEWRPLYGGQGHITLATTGNGGINSPVQAENGTYLSVTTAISTPSHLSGGWHHYEMWVKFSTAQYRMWYDGVLKINKDYPDTTGGVRSFSGYVSYETLGSIDGEEPGTFMRQFDDWEVWDGMPSDRTISGTIPPIPVINPLPTPVISPNPSSPTQLKIN